MKISIVTPSYNQGQFIERTLQSVACQKLVGVELEHVVFDGGSSDCTVQVLKDFEPGVHWISKRDRGQTDAVNQGIKSTDGEIIGWINSDDIYYEGALQKVADYFKDNPNVEVAYGMADHIDLNDKAFESYPTETWNFERLKETCFICQPALFFRRSVIVKYGFLDESLSYCMDYEYWLRLGLNGVVFGYIQSKLAGSRLYSDNKTLGSRVQVHKEINCMLKDLLGTVPDRWLFNYAHAKIERQINRRKRPYLFKMRVAISSIHSAIRWNRRISKLMVKKIMGWMFN